MKFRIYLIWNINIIIERTNWNFKWKAKSKRKYNEYKTLNMKTCNKRLFEEYLKTPFNRSVYIIYHFNKNYYT